MSDISNYEYWKEIESIADDLACRAMDENDNDREAAEDQINDYMLHEDIDSHQWVIYNAYNADVMRHSDNEDYYTDNFGNEDAGIVLQERGLSGLHNVIAFWCMYADVQDKLSDALDNYEEQDAA